MNTGCPHCKDKGVFSYHNPSGTLGAGVLRCRSCGRSFSYEKWKIRVEVNAIEKEALTSGKGSTIL